MASTHPQPRGRLNKFLNPQCDASLSLRSKGYAIVRVCTPERAERLQMGVWTDLESLGTGIDRNDPSSWTNANWPQTTHGLLQNQGWGLMPGTCKARLKTWRVWNTLFGERTISSFDAVSVARPASQERTMRAEMKHMLESGEETLLSSWLHTDQAKGKPQCMEHVQGAFALTDLGAAEQRTQLVVPRDETIQSFRDRFLAAFPPPSAPMKGFDAEREEWIKHTPEERRWLLDNGEVITPTLQAGEMLLWDSGVPHASMPGPLTEGGRRTRMSVFVSSLPLSLIDSADLKVRREMLESGDTSGHRVTSKGKRTYRQCKFSKVGRTYGKEVRAYDTSGVLSGFKRAVESGEDSTTAKIARMCGGY